LALRGNAARSYCSVDACWFIDSFCFQPFTHAVLFWRQIHVLQADGNYDIEQGKNLGDKGDFWVKDMVLGPDDTWPNTNSYQGGVVKKTGIKITVLSDSGFIMLFKVEGLSGGFSPSLVAIDPIDMKDVIDQGDSSGLDDAPGNTTTDPSTAGSTVAWVLSLLAGVAATLGVALFFFV
jgi:hypothetical protein